MTIDKEEIRRQILLQLESDQALLLKAAKDAHSAATDPESIAEDKYDTRGLEASYLAQGQANRAQEIRSSLEAFRTLRLQSFDVGSQIRLSAVVTLEADSGTERMVFPRPASGGLQVVADGKPVVVITPASPLGQALIGKECGDLISVKGGETKEYEILSIC